MANCFNKCCEPPGVFEIVVYYCGGPIAATQSLTLLDGTPVPPAYVDPFSPRYYYHPIPGGILTLTMPTGYDARGPITLPAEGAGAIVIITTTVTPERGECCGPGLPVTLDITWSGPSGCGTCRNETLTWSATCPYTPTPPGTGTTFPGWYSPIFLVSCGAYDPNAVNVYYYMPCQGRLFFLNVITVDGPFMGNEFTITALGGHPPISAPGVMCDGNLGTIYLT